MFFDINETEAAEISSEIGVPSLFEDDIEVQQGERKGIVGRIVGWIAGAAGGAWNFIKGVLGGDFSLSGLVRRAAGWLVQASSFILNFNWNVSPQEIEAQMKGSLINLAGLFGETVGGAMGWTFCGLGAASVMGAINPAVAAKAYEAATEEGKEEMMSYLTTFANSAVQAFASSAFMYGYASVRRVVLKFFDQDKRLKEIEEGRAKPWTINLAFDNFIEWLEDKGFIGQLIASPIESLKEELFDSCGEAIMVVADSVADTLEAMNLAEERRNPYRLVEVSS